MAVQVEEEAGNGDWAGSVAYHPQTDGRVEKVDC